MIATLLVVLAVFLVTELLILRSRTVSQPVVRMTWDGRPLLPPQTTNRILLRDVAWIWMYGYLPSRPYTPGQKLILGARIAMVGTIVVLTAAEIVWRLTR